MTETDPSAAGTRNIKADPAVNNSAKIYDKISKKIPTFQPLEQFFVQEYFPQITQEDIDNEYIIRYFTRLANHSAGEIYEISKQTFDRIKLNNLYKSIEIKWRIAGKLDDVLGPVNINSPTRLFTGAITANKLTLDTADKEMPGMNQKITNPTQFYKGTG